MSSTAAGVIFVVVLAVALAVVYRPFGDYMYWTVTSKRHLRVERVVYRLVRRRTRTPSSPGACTPGRCWRSPRCRCCSCTCSSGCSRTCGSASACPT